MPRAAEAPIEVPEMAGDPDVGGLVVQANTAVAPQVASEAQELFDYSNARELPEVQDGIQATTRCEVEVQNVAAMAVADVPEWSPIPQTSSREAPDSIGFAGHVDGDGEGVEGDAHDEGPTAATVAAETRAEQPAEVTTTTDTPRAAEADAEQPSAETSAEVHAAEASADAPGAAEGQEKQPAETTSVALEEFDQRPADVSAVDEPSLAPHPESDALALANSLEGAATEVPTNVVE
jgi:hypothetical protein